MYLTQTICTTVKRYVPRLSLPLACAKPKPTEIRHPRRARMFKVICKVVSALEAFLATI